MKKSLVLMLVPALLLIASGAALAQDATPEPVPPTVFVRQHPDLGPYLTDPNGMTLYLFTNDTEAGVSTCYDQCAERWPIFTAAEPLALPNGVEGELTLITRDDGTTQVAYNGWPLYYFANDAAPGDVNGQAVGDVWWVIAPGTQFGAAATPAAMGEATPEAPMAGGTVEVTLSEFAIEASTVNFTVGQEYTFNVTNAGEFPHEFVIEPVGSADRAPLQADGSSAIIPGLEGGQSGTLTWTFTEPGTYQLACHFRTHYPQGMAITIHVS